IEKEDDNDGLDAAAPLGYDEGNCSRPGDSDNHIFYSKTTFEFELMRTDPDPFGIDVSDKERYKGSQIDPIPEEKDRPYAERYYACEQSNRSVCTADLTFVDCIFFAIKSAIKRIGCIHEEAEGTILGNPDSDTCKQESNMKP